MGTVFIVIGSAFIICCCGSGVFLGYIITNMSIMGQPMHQFLLGTDSVLIAWLAALALGIVLAIITGVPLVVGGNMYNKGKQALRTAKAI